MIRNQLDFVRAAGETKRFHTFPVLRTQNIAEHSWHVTMLLYLVFGQQEPGITPTMIMTALLHDAAEFKVGDLPAPAKRSMGERIDVVRGGAASDFKLEWDEMEQEILSEVALDFDKFLSEEELLKIKFCDSLDGLLYCVRERALGNQLISECFYNFDKYVEGILGQMKPHEHADRRGTPDESPYDKAVDVFAYAREQWEMVNGGF